MGTINGSLGAKADIMGSAKERYGGKYTFAYLMQNSNLYGVLRFPLQHLINTKKRVTKRNKKKKIIWYCPFIANDITVLGNIDQLSINHQDLYFLGTKLHLQECYRSILPNNLLDKKYHSGRYRNSSGVRNIIYRVPFAAFNSTFFSGKGKLLRPSLELFINQTTNLECNDSRFNEVSLKQKIELLEEMKYNHGIRKADKIFQGELYAPIKK
jgi:hypothetical protein